MELDRIPRSSDVHAFHSTMRERIIEHVFVADMLRFLWARRIPTAEVLRSEFDAGGYDLVLSLGTIMRHVQLKSTVRGGKAASVKVSRKLAERPSGCVVWFIVSEALVLEEFLWFGGVPGDKLPDIECFSVAKHTKGNSLGVKLELPNHRVIPKSQFTRLESFGALMHELFGSALMDGSMDFKAKPSSTPIQRVDDNLDLDALIDGITPENLHPEIDWGPAVGKERFWEEE